jgi:hypothetical protein
MNLHFRPFADHDALTQRSRYLHPIIQSPFLRPFNNMAAHNPDEMAEFQRLSDRYQPDLEVKHAYKQDKSC